MDSSGLRQRPPRPRANTCFPSSSTSIPESSLLNSLDLCCDGIRIPTMLASFRDQLLGRILIAEEEVRVLKEFCESSSESDEDWEIVSRKKGKGKKNEIVEEELSNLQHFIQFAGSFLESIKIELGLESNLSLENILLEYDLPKLDLSTLITSLDDKKSAVVAKLMVELNLLQSIIIKVGQNVQTSVEETRDYFPTPPIASVRDYFTTESDKLSKTLQSLQTSTYNSISTATSTLSSTTTASLASATTLINSSSSAATNVANSAIEEASRFYKLALEGGKKRLLLYEELPPQWKNNQHILSGYRFIAIDRWGAILRSAFEFHNETINIHSHFIGFLSLVYLLCVILPASPAASVDANWGDLVIAIIFITAGMKCLLCSTAWHLLAGCATSHWHRGAACVDYVGISGLIAASVIGMEYYGLYCQPKLAIGYIIFSGVLGICGMIMPWQPWFNMRKYKPYRIAFFLTLAGSALMPLAHMSYLFGLRPTFNFFAPDLPSIAAYLIGLSFYANQFPECTSPGKWDHFFASHQVWHFAIVSAVWSHWFALNTWAASAGQGLSCAVAF